MRVLVLGVEMLDRRVFLMADQGGNRTRVPEEERFDLFSNRSECDGCNAMCFEDVGKRTHGTRTQGSHRGQYNDVDTLLLQ